MESRRWKEENSTIDNSSNPHYNSFFSFWKETESVKILKISNAVYWKNNTNISRYRNIPAIEISSEKTLRGLYKLPFTTIF